MAFPPDAHAPPMISLAGIFRTSAHRGRWASVGSALFAMLAAGCAAQGKVGAHARTNGNSEMSAEASASESTEPGGGAESAELAGAPADSSETVRRGSSRLGGPAAPAPSDPSLAGLDEVTSAGPAGGDFAWILPGTALTGDRASKPVCGCIAASIGPPSDPSFSGAPPSGAGLPADALMVAIAPAGCPDGVRPSIAGIRRIGSDVFVEVESGRAGAPVARGAVLAAPPPGGRLVLRPRPGQTTVGPLGGTAGCMLKS